MQEEVKAVGTLKMCIWQKNYFERQRDDHLFHLTVRQLGMGSIFIKYSDCFTQTRCSEDNHWVQKWKWNLGDFHVLSEIT